MIAIISERIMSNIILISLSISYKAICQSVDKLVENSLVIRHNLGLPEKEFVIKQSKWVSEWNKIFQGFEPFTIFKIFWSRILNFYNVDQ